MLPLTRLKGRRRQQLAMLGVALTDFMRDNSPYISAGIAYWTLFSLFPLALAGIAIMGYVFDSPGEQRRVVEGIIELIPVSEGYLSELVGDVVEARGTLGVFGILGLLWAGTAVFSAVRKGINHAWQVRRPPYFLVERAVDFVMLIGVGVLALAHVLFTTNLLGVSTLSTSLSETSAWIPIRVASEIAAFAFTVAAFALLYRFVPHTRVEWSDIWLGVFIGAVLFHSVRMGFSLAVSYFGDLNALYGSLGSVMAFLVWAYFSGIAIVLGARVAYTYCGVFGSRAGTIVLPSPKRRTVRARGLRGLLATLWSWLLPPAQEEQL